MVADPLTKALPAKHYEHITGLLNMTDGLNQSGRMVDEKHVRKVFIQPPKVSSLGISGASKLATGGPAATSGMMNSAFPMAQGAYPPDGGVGEDWEASK